MMWRSLLSLLMLNALMNQALTEKVQYKAQVSLSGIVDSNRQTTTAFSLPFHMMSSKINFGQSEGVDLFYLKIEDDCSVKGINYLQRWYAAYVYIPDRCDEISIIESLEQDGADFIFIERQNTARGTTLNMRNLEIPVFILLDNNRDKYFLENVQKAYKQIKELKDKKDEETKKAKKDDKSKKPANNKANSEALKILRLYISFPFRLSKGSTAKVNFFYSPANIRSFEYASALSEVYTDLKEYMTLEPSVVVYKLRRNVESHNPNCYKNSPYCAADPDGDGEFTGEDVVKESLREKCVFFDSKDSWFTYLQKYSTSCSEDFSEKCSESVMASVGVNTESILKCVSNSNIGKGDNTILQADYTKLSEVEDMAYPLIEINDASYKAVPSPVFLGNAICETLLKKPEICNKFTLANNFKQQSSRYSKISTLAYLYSITIGLLVLALICICLARRTANREIKDEVQKSVANYFAIKETDSLK